MDGRKIGRRKKKLKMHFLHFFHVSQPQEQKKFFWLRKFFFGTYHLKHFLKKFCVKTTSHKNFHKIKIVALGESFANLKFQTCRLTGSRVIDPCFSKVPSLTLPRKLGAGALPTFKYCSESKLQKSKVVALGELCANLEF